MSEKRVGEFIRTHKRAELIGLGGAAAAGVGFIFGRKALEHRRAQRRYRDAERTPEEEKRYQELLKVFENPAIKPAVRRTMAVVASSLYIETKDTEHAVLTLSELRSQAGPDAEHVPLALMHLRGLIAERPNPKYMGGEGATTGYYASELDFHDQEGDVEHTIAPTYYSAVKARLDSLDQFGSQQS